MVLKDWERWTQWKETAAYVSKGHNHLVTLFL